MLDAIDTLTFDVSLRMNEASCSAVVRRHFHRGICGHIAHVLTPVGPRCYAHVSDGRVRIEIPIGTDSAYPRGVPPAPPVQMLWRGDEPSF